MPDRSRKPRDLNKLAASIVDAATAEETPADPDERKDPAAVELGRKGGLKGGKLQNNVLNRQRWHTREELRLAIAFWIERTYHRRRRQRALGRLTPIEFEAVHEVAHAA